MVKRLDQIVVVDVEATCWEGEQTPEQESEIIEIGLCTVDVASGQRLEKRSIVVKPEHSTVSEFCARLTTLTQEQVEQGVSFGEACNILQSQYHTKQRVWASYGDYDRRMFERQCQSRSMEYPFGPTHINVKNLVAIAYGWKREVGLARALQRMGLRFEGIQHRGIDDAWNIAHILSRVLLQRRALIKQLVV